MNCKTEKNCHATLFESLRSYILSPSNKGTSQKILKHSVQNSEGLHTRSGEIRGLTITVKTKHKGSLVPDWIEILCSSAWTG